VIYLSVSSVDRAERGLLPSNIWDDRAHSICWSHNNRSTPGAVGSVVCQIAKEKDSWLINHAGIDYAFNYKKLRDDNIATELRKAYSQSSSEEEGIHLYFDKVENTWKQHLIT
jgi:hypothetical protein